MCVYTVFLIPCIIISCDTKYLQVRWIAKRFSFILGSHRSVHFHSTLALARHSDVNASVKQNTPDIWILYFSISGRDCFQQRCMRATCCICFMHKFDTRAPTVSGVPMSFFFETKSHNTEVQTTLNICYTHKLTTDQETCFHVPAYFIRMNVFLNFQFHVLQKYDLHWQ